VTYITLASVGMGILVDIVDVGTGPPVVLLHSSVSGNRQGKALIADLRDRHRVLPTGSPTTAGTWPRSGARTSWLRS
jgi:hypothetical protein